MCKTMPRCEEPPCLACRANNQRGFVELLIEYRADEDLLRKSDFRDTKDARLVQTGCKSKMVQWALFRIKLARTMASLRKTRDAVYGTLEALEAFPTRVRGLCTCDW